MIEVDEPDEGHLGLHARLLVGIGDERQVALALGHALA